MLKTLLSAGAACVVLAVTVVAGATPTSNDPPSNPSGTAQVGATLTITAGTYTGTDGAEVTVTDQWQRCDDGAGNGCVDTGATGTSYLVVAADLGKYLRVAETASDGIDPPAGPAYTSAVGPVAAAPQAPQLGNAPAITGADLNVGQSLSRTAGTWTGNPTPTVTAAWQRCNDAAGNGCANVGSGDPTYTLAAADLGKYMRVRETATNGVAPDGQAASNVLGPVTQPLAAATPPVIDKAAPVVGDTIAVTSNGTWTGFPQPTGYTYLWQRCDTNAGGNCVAAGTAATYAVVAADAGKWIRVQVTASNGTTQAQSAWVQIAQAVQQAPANTAPPSISPSNSNLVFNRPPSLAILTISANTGTWAATPAVTSYAYEWQRCPTADPSSCATIAGATTTPYAVQQADVGSFLRVKVTATNGVNPAGVAFSALTSAQVRQRPYQGPTDPATPVPSITEPNDGIPNVGETLQGSAGTWFAFPAPSLTPQWLRCDPAGSNCTAVDPQPAFSPAITTGPEPYRHTNAGGSWQYVVTAADVGSSLRLVAYAYNSVYPVASQGQSVATAVVQSGPVNLTDLANGAASLSGTAARGQAMVANSGLWSGFTVGGAPLALTHEWQRCPADGNLAGCVPVGADPPLSIPLSPAGATTCSTASPCGGTSQYALTDADLGARLRVVIRASNSIANVTVATALTDVVVGSPIIPLVDGSPDPASLPAVTGDALQGLTLVASTGSWSAFPGGDAITYAYQWLRCIGADVGSCTPVGGATTPYYQVGPGDVGSQIRVRVTAVNGVLPDGVATSAPTAVVPGGAGGGIGGPGADMIVQLTASTTGSDVTYKVRVGNIGTVDAEGVVVTATLADGLTLKSSSSTKGTCSGRVTCSIGQVKSGEFVTVSIAVSSASSGNFSFSATVSSTTKDVNPSNNSVTTGSRLTTISPAPKAGDVTTVGIGPTSTQLSVPLSEVSLRARRVGKNWVAATTFTLYSGKANLKLVATQNGSSKPLTMIKGSRLGTVTTKANATQIQMTANKAATFPVKVILPAQGFSTKAVYVIRITGTTLGGASTLNIGFKGAALVARTAVARTLGKTWVTGATLPLATGKGTALRAWVTPAGSTKKLPLLKGSRLGTTVGNSVRTVLTSTAKKAGSFPVRAVLAAKGLSAKKVYLLRVEAKSPDGIWTDYEVRFKGKGAARALTGTRATP